MDRNYLRARFVCRSRFGTTAFHTSHARVTNAQSRMWNILRENAWHMYARKYLYGVVFELFTALRGAIQLGVIKIAYECRCDESAYAALKAAKLNNV